MVHNIIACAKVMEGNLLLEKLGIELVRLNLPFRLNHVNCFLSEGSNGWLIIDAGLNNAYTRNVWDEKLQDKTVSEILITHYHPDHYGYAGGLQEKTGAQVIMTEIDDRAGKHAWTDTFIRSIRKNYDKTGIPQEIADQMTSNTEEFKEAVTPYPKVTRYFNEGEMITIGKEAYEVIFTPGHSDGLVCFYNKENKVLISTDHILPKITPNISYWFHGHNNPLQAYFLSLEKILKLNVEYVIPSHGKPFHDANKRINEIITHHNDRLAETLHYLKKASTVYEVCQRLFPNQLTVHEMRFAIGETLAHLEYLKYKGECVREMQDGSWYYKCL